MRGVSSWIALIAVSAGGCSEYDLLGDRNEPTLPLPVIQVTPNVLVFGLVADQDQSSQFFQIENVGNDTLILGDLRLEGSAAYSLTTDASGQSLEPSETVDAMVTYQPLGDPDVGQAVIPSNDAETPEAVVTFSGGLGLPVLEVDPPSLDFGWVEVGLEATEVVTVTNVGSAGTDVVDAWTGIGPYSVTAFDPGPLLPGSSTDVAVRFAPTEGGVFPDVLTIQSGVPDLLVPITGEGVASPLAVCDALPLAPIVPIDEVVWLGDQSSDPGGLPLDYDWVLRSAPAGSAVPMPAGNLTDPNRYGFFPDLPGTYEGELTVTNSYGLVDTCTVVVQGAVLPPVADCSATPPSPVVGQDEVIWIGDTSSDPSGLPLTYDWVLLTAPAGSGVPMPAGAPAAPNRYGFHPDLPGLYEAQLTVTNSLGEVDTCVAQVQATEIVEPVAVCSVSPNPTEAIYGSADLLGDLSWDPGGLPLTYTWTGVSRPPGSGAGLPGGAPTQPNRYGFVPDVVGFYDFELVVTNSNGVSSPPCVATLEAIPAEEIWIEMFWTVGGDDMDLHVVRNGGIPNMRTNQDCYYSNCTNGLSWGPGGPAGDPRLDLDDIGGTGPENVNIHIPESTTYDVVVHDFPGSVYNGVNDVTVNIYLAGVLAWSNTIGISGENQDVYFATIDWATMSVTP